MRFSLMPTTAAYVRAPLTAVRPTYVVRKQSLHHGAVYRPMACAASSMSQASVFLSHAGEQKKVFVDVLYHLLTEERIRVFMDEPSLVPGTPESWNTIVRNLKTAAVGGPSVLMTRCFEVASQFS